MQTQSLFQYSYQLIGFYMDHVLLYREQCCSYYAALRQVANYLNICLWSFAFPAIFALLSFGCDSPAIFSCHYHLSDNQMLQEP